MKKKGFTFHLDNELIVKIFNDVYLEYNLKLSPKYIIHIIARLKIHTTVSIIIKRYVL